MKAYLITMFIFWIVKISLTWAISDSEDIPCELRLLCKIIGFCISIGMAVWTGMLLF